MVNLERWFSAGFLENFYIIFNDCIIFHHQYSIIDLTISLFLNFPFSVTNNAEINISTSLFPSFNLLISRSGITSARLKDMNILMKDFFSKGKLFYMATSNVLLYRFHGDGQHWVLSFNMFWGNIIPVKYSILWWLWNIISSLYTHVRSHLALVSFCQFSSWAVSVCGLSVSYILFTHIINKQHLYSILHMWFLLYEDALGQWVFKLSPETPGF